MARNLDTRITIPLHEAPDVISASLRTVLAEHGFVVCERRSDPDVIGEIVRPISDECFEKLIVEVGANAAGSLAFRDES